MKYSGKLYGKIGRKYIPLIHTSETVDQLERELAEARANRAYETDMCTTLRCERDEAIEQRDRLAEALRQLMFNSLRYRIEPSDPCYEESEEALAAVEGGRHE